MNDNTRISLRFDRFVYTVSYGTVKELILKELNRLSAETKYPIKGIPVYFKEKSTGNAVAYFRRSGNKPVSFTFCLDTFDGVSANEIYDTCRHEFAHFMVCMDAKPNQKIIPHGEKWAAACRRVGARVDTHIHNELTQHFIS